VEESAEVSIEDRYRAVRGQSEALTTPLVIEDFGVQPMEDASPPKWHLAHTSWFFETFLLDPYLPAYEPFDERYEYLFNSYYNGVGEPFPRPRRGHLSRPTVAEVFDYRRHVDAAMLELLAAPPAGAGGEVIRRAVLGLNHEQQHQELLLTDLKYNFGHNPLLPAYTPVSADVEPDRATRPLAFFSHPGGLARIGIQAGQDFHFDNEAPAHRVYLEPFALADRLVTCEEYLAFIADGGYRDASLWLSDGWAWVNGEGIDAPLYWYRQDDGWWEYRLTGAERVGGAVPVTHISAYEADAYARWAGCRLPTEAEWEVVATGAAAQGNFVESGRYHPCAAGVNGSDKSSDSLPAQLFGDVWEWTSSAYGPYPGYQCATGTLGEYNGKFMANQLVLRGGSCATPGEHIRPSYRNFFYPPDRWQFTGIRLARDGG